MTNGEILKAEANKRAIPLRTLAQVQECLTRDKKKKGNVDVTMARMMLHTGRLTDEAQSWVIANYPQR